jgi:cold shock CspA family protein
MNQHFKHKASTWPPSSIVDRHHTGSDDLSVVARRDHLRDGYVKWYDEERKFGFIVDSETGKDVFLHWRCVKKCKLRAIDLPEESHVKFASRPPTQDGHYRDEVTELVLVK